MANRDLLVGSIVKLSTNTDWPLTEANPRGIVGEVTGNAERWVYVRWSNRSHNSYTGTDSDLILIESP